MHYCTNCGMEKSNATKFCRNCGERGIDFRTISALKVEADQVKMKKGGNEAVIENLSTLDAIEQFRKDADELARRRNQQS
jgi:predicted  nucleic acid-binding Zn-ribbon protein